MRTHLLLFVSLCLLIITPATAQDDESPEYTLRVPTAGELVTLLQESFSNDVFTSELFTAISDDIAFHDLNLADVEFTLLYDVYQELGDNDVLFNHNQWVPSILTSWLRDNSVNLDDLDELTIEDFQIRISSVDFDDDNQNEYILETIRNGDFEQSLYGNPDYTAYLTVYTDENGYYQVRETPLGWNFTLLPHWAVGEWEVLRFEDVNADGVTEWLVLEYGTNSGVGAQEQGKLYVLRWNGYELIDIAPQGNGFLNDVRSNWGWEFIQTNNTSALEFSRTYTQVDNWGCTFADISIAYWHPELEIYTFDEENRNYDDILGCAWIQAELAMWRNEYAIAINHYEHGVALSASSDELSEYDTNLLRYEQLRLALAYALNNEPDNASALLNELINVDIPYDNLATLIELAYSAYADQDELALCTAMYNYFVDDSVFSGGDGLFTYVGQHLIGTENFALFVTSPQPYRIGCNVNHLIETRLATHNLATTNTPLAIFDELNIPVRYSLNMDFASDGVDEWIVWVEGFVNPFMFVPDEQIYTISRPAIPLDNDQTTVTSFNLPDDVGSVVLRIGYHDELYFGGCASDTDQINGRLELWYLEESSLRLMVDAVICNEVEAQALIEGDINEWQGWISAYPFGVLEASFLWDSEQQGYFLSEAISELLEQLYQEFDEPYALTAEEELIRSTNSLRILFINNEEFEQRITEISTYLTDDTIENYDLIYRAHFYLALAYEQLNRPDEALAEYIVIYESAPESAWGMLADLHLEVVE